MTGHTPWSEIRHKRPAPIATYTLTLHKSISTETAIAHPADLYELLRETEENLTDLLPNGWWAEIHEWDEGVNDDA